MGNLLLLEQVQFSRLLNNAESVAPTGVAG